ncbi:MAG: cytochrome P450 [Actinomycetes bacterium]
MTEITRAPGIPASLEPVNWQPTGLPDDPDEIFAWLLDRDRRGEMYPLLRRLREVAPVHRNRPETFGGAWTFTRYAETDEIFRNPRVVNNPLVVEQAFTHGDGSFTGVMRDVMLWSEPEPHQRVRNLVKSAFTPRAIGRWQPIAERVANELIDGFEHDGAVDLVARYNYEIPFRVIAHILGVRESDFPHIKTLAWDFARAGEKMVTPEVSARGDAAARGFEEYFGALAEERSAAPGDDLVSALLAAEAAGDRLSRRELVANCILLLQAGHETTQDLLGNAEVALFRHPDQLALLRDRPDLTKNAVEECLRYDASVQTNHRVVLDGMTIGDHVIPERGMIYIFLGAINRDPARYPDPDRLDLGRDVTSHLAFSFGAYYCLGAALARIETQVGLRTLLDRLPGLRPATGEFEWRDSLLLRGPQRLPVAW